MKRFFPLFLALLLILSLTGCASDTVQFHGSTIPKSALSPETLDWLKTYNALSTEEQLSISYIPHDLYEYLGYSAAQDAPAP